MLLADNLSYAYSGSTAIRFPEISCGQNEHLLILGESGCGKTTLLHLLAGLIKPDQGSVMINDVNISTLRASKLDKFRVIILVSFFSNPISCAP